MIKMLSGNAYDILWGSNFVTQEFVYAKTCQPTAGLISYYQVNNHPTILRRRVISRNYHLKCEVNNHNTVPSPSSVVSLSKASNLHVFHSLIGVISSIFSLPFSLCCLYQTDINIQPMDDLLKWGNWWSK